MRIWEKARNNWNHSIQDINIRLFWDYIRNVTQLSVCFNFFHGRHRNMPLFFYISGVEQQVKRIILNGFTRNQSKELGILQAYYKINTGRRMSGCSCKKQDLFMAVKNILIKKGAL